MGPIGVPEMLFILAIALLIFGPKRLPELGRTIGKALGEFRRATTDLKRSIDIEMMADPPVHRSPKAVPDRPVARETAAPPTTEASSSGQGAPDAAPERETAKEPRGGDSG